jgi:hypothetical protein
MKTQVLWASGHQPSPATKATLAKLYPGCELIEKSFNCSRFDRAADESIGYLKSAVALGLDVTGASRIIFVPSGSSITTLLLYQALAGALGYLPAILNLIRTDDITWAPSPGAEVIDANNLRQSARAQLRQFLAKRSTLPCAAPPREKPRVSLPSFVQEPCSRPRYRGPAMKPDPSSWAQP